MYLMYVDESGDSGSLAKGSRTRYFCLSGLVVHEARWREFLETLIAFRKTLRSVYGLPVRAEIHASEFVTKRAYGLQKHVRLAILRNLIDEIAKLDYVSITNAVIDKRGKILTYDIFGNCWGTLFQRFENTLLHGNFPGSHSRDYGMVITDATAGTKLMRMVRKMAVHNYIPNNQSMFGSGSRNIPIRRVIEDPYGKDSSQTLPIQVVDVTAYFLKQRFDPNSYVRRKRATNYFDRLLPVLNTQASRKGPLGIVQL